MPRSLKVTLSFSLLLIILLILDAINRQFPFKEVLKHGLPHLLLFAIAVIIAGISLWILEAVIREQFSPLISKGFSEMASSIRSAMTEGLDTLKEGLSKGFSGLTTAVAIEVRQFPQSWKVLSDANVLAQLEATVKTPEVKELVAAGRIGDAVAKLDDLLLKEHEEEIAVLLLSEDRKGWERAAELLKDPKAQNPKYFLTLAYRFWSVGQTDKAIEIAEKGLPLAVNADPPSVLRFKNSLAYYYAETDRPQYEELARQYAREAREARPDDVAAIDTEGYVKISFAKTRREVEEGVALSEEARRRGAPFEAYAKDVAKASRRLESLPDKS